MENRKIYNNVILECKQQQEFKKRYKQNFIEFDDYFKYSGKVEKPNDNYLIYEKKINKFDKFHNNNRHILNRKLEKYEKIISEERSREYNKYKKIIKDD